MMDDDRPTPLPAELARRIELERKAHEKDELLRRKVLRRIETIVTLREDAAPQARASSNSLPSRPARQRRTRDVAALALVMFATGAVAGGGVAKLVSASSPDVSVTVAKRPAEGEKVVPTSAEPTSVPSPTIEPTPAAPPPSATPTSSSGARVRAAPGPSATNGDLIKERELLDVARAALARGRPVEALDVAREHAQKWPYGLLVEEREVVLIQALVAAGRRQDAEASAVRFRRRFPQSMLMPAVDLALQQSTP